METTRRQRLRRVHRRPRLPTPGRIRVERTPLLPSAAALAPSPTRHPPKPSGHSETGQNPTAHHPPRYSPKARRKPSARSGKEPSLAYPCGEPHISVLGHWAPHAVVIKVFVTDHV